MGLPKSDQFNEEQNRLASLAKALSTPARIAILEFIVAQKACICGDIVEELPLSQSTISQHLKELKDLGLIQGEIDGPKMCYCIDEENWKSTANAFQNFFQKYKPQKQKGC